MNERKVADRRGRFLQSRARPPGQHDIGAMLSQSLGHTAPDASAGTGDDAHLAAEIEIRTHQLAPSRLIFCARLQRCTSDGPS